MAHYAYIDDNNIVTQVVVGRDENDLPEGVSSWEEYFSNKGKGRCLRTSYNTRNNTHVNGGIPFRGNFAGVGSIYDEDLDAFYRQKPFPSWSFDEDILDWNAPVPSPDDGIGYYWDEEEQAWFEILD